MDNGEQFERLLDLIGLDGAGIDQAVELRRNIHICTGKDVSNDIIRLLTPTHNEIIERLKLMQESARLASTSFSYLPKKSKHNKARQLRFAAKQRIKR